MSFFAAKRFLKSTSFVTLLSLSLLALPSCSKKADSSDEWNEFKSDLSSPSVQSNIQQITENAEESKSEKLLKSLLSSLPDTMYVANLEGASVLLEPNSESVKIAELPFNAPVKILGIESETEPFFVKVSVPRYLRTNGNDEGYIIGEMLAKNKNPLTSLSSKWKAKNLAEYLESSAWKKTGVLQYWIFNTDGTFSLYTPDSDNKTTGSWKAVNGSSIEITRNDSQEAEALRVRIQDANKCVIGSDYFESKFSLDSLTPDILDTPIAYSTDEMGYTLLEYAALMNASESFIDSLIKAGVSAGISNYHEQYDEYWQGKKAASCAVSLEWQDLADYWADDFEYLYTAQDIDGDGEREGLYSFKDGRKYELALIKPNAKKMATLYLNAPSSYDKAKNPYCKLYFPYNLSEKKLFLRIINPHFSDSLFVVENNGELKTIYDENDSERTKKDERKLLFSENSVISLDLESSFGVITNDNAKQYHL